MDWRTYVQKQLNVSSSLSHLSTTLGDEVAISIPPLIRVTLDIIDKLLATGEKHIIMVFPEKTESGFFLVVMKTLNDITEGKMQNTYDPYSFKKGEKLKFRNCVVEFDRISEEYGKTYLFVRTGENCSVGLPIETAPLFQKTITNRRLSTPKEFDVEKREACDALGQGTSNEQVLASIAKYQTHFDSTVFYVAPTGKTKKLLLSATIDGAKLSDILLIGQVNYDGEISILGKGQLSGVPPIVLSPDLYATVAALDTVPSVRGVIIDISNPNTINGQLDALDELRQSGVPIICYTNTADSFELDALKDRNFYVWRWDEDSIVPSVIPDTDHLIGKRTSNCAFHEIDYIDCPCNELDSSFEILYQSRTDVESATGEISNAFDHLFSIAFKLLRSITDLSEMERKNLFASIETAKREIKVSARFNDETLCDNLNEVSDLLAKFCDSKTYRLPKVVEFEKWLQKGTAESICLVVPDRENTAQINLYWEKYCKQNDKAFKIKRIRVFSENEYLAQASLDYNVTVICSWLNKERMRKIIYGFRTNKYVVFLYPYEERWKRPHQRYWHRILHCGEKHAFLKKALPGASQSFHAVTEKPEGPAEKPSEDGPETINMILRENQYRKYIASGDTRDKGSAVPAIPLYFVGGHLGFYRTAHKLITATDIVNGIGNEIRMVIPADIKVGDFVIVREAQRDLIREMADNILIESGMDGIQKTATKWRDALDLENHFSNFDTIYKKLCTVGCKKSALTVMNWMSNEDIIAPRDKEDLIYIARATEDQVLEEQMDEIYEAGRRVKSAHVQAGMNLSELLKKRIADKLQDHGPIDPFNFWDPLSLDIESIGPVKLLKVIDVCEEIMVEDTDTNHLIEEL